MLTLSIQQLRNSLAFLTDFWDFFLFLRAFTYSVLASSRIQQQIYNSVLLTEIFDWGKLEYDPFLLQVYHQSMMFCQHYKENPNLFLPLHSKKRLGSNQELLPSKSTRTF
jgi:hypothetical protein